MEPIYLEASNSAIPEVKRVIVAYGDKIAYESTLTEALRSLFGNIPGLTSAAGSGGTSEPSVIGEEEGIEVLVTKAVEAYDKAQDALKSGDWAAYGRYMDELEAALKALEKEGTNAGL